jgi:predicted phosphodiesterase
MEFTDQEVAELLQAIVDQLPTRDACIALGLSPKSYGTLRSLCDDYEVKIPNRVNQHTGNEYVFDPDNPADGYEEVNEIRSDGSYYSDKLLSMSKDQLKDPTYLLEAHGFDPCEWEIVNARNNIWNVFSNDKGVQQLYSSKITAKPLKSRFDVEEIAEALSKVEPIRVIGVFDSNATGMLEIPFYDMHWGTSYLDHYQGTLDETMHIINERQREEIVIPIGSDLFHHDNFKSSTSNGTVVEGINWPKAWADAATFFFSIIALALQMGKRVKIIYVKGNHDESMAWTFCQMLAVKFPQAEFDLEIEERKSHRYEDVFIGFTHGDKATKDIDRVFIHEFPQIVTCAVKEIHSGHYHHEVTKDQFGIVNRSLCTKNLTDGWHKDKGFVGAVKRFMIFEYTNDSLKSIRYV